MRHKLRQLYGIEQAPCNTYWRERLDAVDPKARRAVHKRLFGCLQQVRN